jgi:hypothetical protein
MKNWYKSRTIWYAILTGVAGIVAAFATEYPEITVLASIKAVAVFVLRVITNESIK